jgi:hypothetical protein
MQPRFRASEPEPSRDTASVNDAGNKEYEEKVLRLYASGRAKNQTELWVVVSFGSESVAA